MVAIFYDVAAYRKYFIPQCFQSLFYTSIQNNLPEEADEVVGHHYLIERRFCGVKALQIEVVCTKIIFYFFDPVFAISSLFV